MQGTFLGVFARLVVLPEVGIARLLGDSGWEHWRRRRSVCGLAGVDASSSLALSDEVGGALVGDDLEVVGATGVEEVDGRGGPVSEDDGPLLLPHGDVLGVVVPVITASVELSLEFSGDGEDEDIVRGRVAVGGTEKGSCFGLEECLDLSPDLWSDG